MKFTSSYFFVTLLIIFLLSGAAIILQHQGFALKLLIISFWTLVLGVIFYILELKNEK